ncbi:MAG: TSUP family transporter, partial [Desulfonatronovibrionaceae bacterium]
MASTFLICLLTLTASGIGTATGFGTSTVMIPVMIMFLPFPAALLFVGVIHLFGDIWKVILFRRGLDWKLLLAFGLSGIAASFAGASLSLHFQQLPLKRILGGFLLLYVFYLLLKR